MIRGRTAKVIPRNVFFTLSRSTISGTPLLSPALINPSLPDSYFFNLRFLSYFAVRNAFCPDCSVPRDPNFVGLTKQSRSIIRKFCGEKSGSSESSGWTEEVEYLDESGSVIHSGEGIRSVEPGLDDHVLVGGLKKPLMNASAVAKIVEVVQRWKWGPELETQLDKLQFVSTTAALVDQSMALVVP